MLLNQGQAAPAAGDNLVSDTTTQTFMQDVVEESRKRPVLVDFWAPWCGPCKTLSPVIEKVIRAAKGKVKLVKMNIDEHPAVAQQLGIQSIPTVYAFVNGQPVDGFMGALPESQVAAFVERLAGKIEGGVGDILKEADALLMAGDAAGAAELYAQVLAEESDNVHALGGLARSHVEGGNLAAAQQTLSLVPKGKENDPAVATARAALELAERAASVGDLADLEAKVATNAADHQARFDLAVALNAKGMREQALDHLLEIIRRQRNWNEDAARKQLLQFFEAWGPADEMTVEGRRRLSSLLFS
ncbi:MAG: thioredoxin [Bradyrhizobiaceae bacterium]|nr:thioredoxin [Bradyrhizobiaceae bacterium]